jgi:mono/diheme cytochrome c family protein
VVRTALQRLSSVFSILVLALVLGACGMNMFDQPKAEVYEESSFFANGTSSRGLIDGTVSRTQGAFAASYLTGSDRNGLLTILPVPSSIELLHRGQERFNIYCAPCHNYNGDGRGIIVQNGFPQPTSFHVERLRKAPVGYFYSAITNGFGRMFSYASRVPPEDRWAITGYIRALQLSQFASPADSANETRIEPKLEEVQ